MASEMSSGMSQCMYSSESAIDDRQLVLIRFSALKDRSAEQLVTGNVHRILIRTLTLGYIEEVWRRVSVGVDGKLTSPCSLQCCCHFMCHVGKLSEVGHAFLQWLSHQSRWH